MSTYINGCLPYARPLLQTAWDFTSGLRQTVQGTLQINNGNIVDGISKTLTGLMATSIVSQSFGADYTTHQNLLKYSLFAGALSATISNVGSIKEGLKNRSILQTIQGISLSILGLASTLYIYGMDSKMIRVAQQSFLMAYTSLYISKLGVHDFTRKNYVKGMGEMLLGITGAAFIGYYVFTEFFQRDLGTPMPADVSQFIEEHQTELSELSHGRIPEKCHRIGSGMQKTAYACKEIPHHVIKASNIPYIKMEKYVDNSNELRSIATREHMSRIVIPTSYYVKEADVAIEEKVDIIKYYDLPKTSEKRAAESEFDRFIAASGADDVSLQVNHNTAFLKTGDKNNLKIGFFDFDSKSTSKSYLTEGVILGAITTFSAIAVAIPNIAQSMGYPTLEKVLKVTAVITGGAAALFGLTCNSSSATESNTIPFIFGSIGAGLTTLSLAVISSIGIVAGKCLQSIRTKCFGSNPVISTPGTGAAG